jgi:hypothetical protein
MKLTIVAGFIAANDGQDNQDGLEQFLDRVMEELLTLDNVKDPTLTAALARGRFSIMLTVDEDLPENAAVVGMAAIRTAFHAAGAATPSWPTFHDLSIATTLVGADQ